MVASYCRKTLKTLIFKFSKKYIFNPSSTHRNFSRLVENDGNHEHFLFATFVNKAFGPDQFRSEQSLHDEANDPRLQTSQPRTEESEGRGSSRICLEVNSL